MTNRTDAEVWVVDDDRSIRFVLERALARAGFRVPEAWGSWRSSPKTIPNCPS